MNSSVSCMTEFQRGYVGHVHNAGYHYDSECIGRKDNRTNVTTATLEEPLALEYQKN